MTTAADVAIVAAWASVLGHNVLLAARGIARTRAPARWLAGLVLVVAVLVCGTRLERASGGRLPVPALVTAAGVLVTIVGAALHVRARRVLGRAWSASPSGPAQLVDAGPYRVVRHPLYAAILLMSAGSVAAHPSAATIAGALGLAAGLALKIVREERALATALGPQWEAYRSRVPRLIPRLSRR